MIRPVIYPFFDEPNHTISYLIGDPATKQAAGRCQRGSLPPGAGHPCALSRA